jgi:hypothetical protein
MPLVYKTRLTPGRHLYDLSRYREFKFWIDWLPPYMQKRFERQSLELCGGSTRTKTMASIRSIPLAEVLTLVSHLLDKITNRDDPLHVRREGLLSLKIIIEL